MRRGKNYKEKAAKIDGQTAYSSAEAVKLVKENAKAKFDETVEVHLRLGIDPKQADQQVRGMVSLPHGTGKSQRVVVFAQGDKAKEAQEAGAEFVGIDELVTKIEKGWLDFEAAVATPDVMSKVGKLGKVLGPKGLMPNPKSGTVTFDVGKVVKDIKGGKFEYRTDKFGIVHAIIGKASFSEEALLQNYTALLDEINRAKPQAAKGKYLKSVSLSSTMSPAIKVDPAKTKEAQTTTL